MAHEFAHLKRVPTDALSNAEEITPSAEQVREADVLVRRRVAIFALNAVTIAVLTCLLYTSPSPRDRQKARMPSSA